MQLLRAPILVSCVLAWTHCGGSSSQSTATPAPKMDQEILNRPPPTKDVEVKNLCQTGVPVYLGETPNGTTGDHIVLRGGGTSHFPRRPDGTFTIWIEDERGYGLAKVHVSRRMSHVEIGASCKTLHAQ
ncbi:hypothetical protein LVJ94_30490 [Pendulispora rubella]|uniref:Secreted protein n=1 Tax=Pendulispora rubella TaxID=2741070 RepID=A0ABZ2KRC5_9BACT